MQDETSLDFNELTRWLTARIGAPIEVQIVTDGTTVAFVCGPIAEVMRFEGDGSRGLIVDGGAGAWSLELAAEEFVSAVVLRVPGSLERQQLLVTMRQHQLMLDLAEAADQ